MFEDTNQAEVINEETTDYEVDDGSNLFVDEVEDTNQPEETTEEATEENTGNAETTEQEQTASAQPEKFSLTHLGNEVNLTMDELKTNAQKGLNYDHIKEERDKYKHTYDLLDKFAKQFGLETSDYIKKVEEEFSATEAKNYAEQNGVTEEGAKQILALQKELDTYKEKESQASKREEMHNAFNKFALAHPDVDIKTLPKEIFDDYVQNGTDFETAYTKYENKQMKAEIEALKQNKKNEETAVGSVKDEGYGNNADPFLDGFNG